MLENPIKNLIDLAAAYGFKQILPNKNHYSVSFRRDENNDCRINYYVTTHTVQVQYKNGKQKILKNEKGLEGWEDILQQI